MTSATESPIGSSENPIIIYSGYPMEPWFYTDNHGKLIGAFTKIFTAITKQTGLHFELVPVPWRRAMYNGEHKDAGVIGLSYTKERESRYAYSENIYTSRLHIIVRKGEAFTYKNIADLKGKTISIYAGSKYGDEFSNELKKKSFTTIETNDSNTRFKLLLKNRADAVIAGHSKRSILHKMTHDEFLKDKLDSFEILPTIFREDKNYIGFSNSFNAKYPHILPQINQVLVKLAAEKTVSKWLEDYYNHSSN